MFAAIIRMFQPKTIAQSAEELKQHINRLFLIISRSRSLMDKFERRLGGLSDADIALLENQLDVSGAIIVALEARLNAVLEMFNGHATLEELDALMQAAIVFSVDSGETRSLSLDGCAVELESLLTNMNEEIHVRTPQSVYLQALARA